MSIPQRGLITKAINKLNSAEILRLIEAQKTAGTLTVVNSDWIAGRVSACTSELQKLRSILPDNLENSESTFGNWPEIFSTAQEALKYAKRGKATWLDFGKAVESLRLKTELVRLEVLDQIISAATGLVATAKIAKQRTEVASIEAGRHRDVAQMAATSAQTCLNAAKDSYSRAKSVALWADKRKSQISNTVSNIAGLQKRAADGQKSVQALKDEALEQAQIAGKLRLAIDEQLLAIQELHSDNERSTLERENRLQDLIERLTTTESKADEILFKATSAKFVETWEKRRKELSDRMIFKQKVVYAATFLAIILAAVAAVMAFQARDKWVEFVVMKLIVASPIVFLLWFSSHQFSRERAMEADYALKVNIGVSLEGYRVFLEGLAPDDQTRARVAEFFIGAIEKLYTPTEFDTPRRAANLGKDRSNDSSGSSNIDVSKITDLVKAVASLKP